MSRTAYPGDVVAFTLLDGVAATAYTIALRRLSDNTLVVGPTSTGVTEQDPGGALSNYTGLVTVPAGAAPGDYQGEFTFGGTTYADEELLEVLQGPVLTGETTTITLVDYQAPERHDTDGAWTSARVDMATDFDGPWFAVETITLEVAATATPSNVWWGDPINRELEASLPEPQSFTVQVDTAALWLRVVWLDADAHEQAGPIVSTGEFPFLPTPAQIATELRALTRDASGNLIGIFSANGAIDDDLVNNVILAAARDVENAAGRRVPGPLIDRARRATALRAAQIAVRSMLPEQSGDDRSSYQALRVDGEAAMENLRKRMRAWRLAYRQAVI